VLSLAEKYSINFHDSLLPEYAGIHATSWALINEEKCHGITWHLMNENIDEGAILRQQVVDISEEETAYSLNVKCFVAATESFTELIDDLADDRLNIEPKTIEKSKTVVKDKKSYFGKYKKVPAGGVITFAARAEEISALVRGLNFGSHPNTLGVPKLKVAEAFVVVKKLTVLDTNSNKNPGTVLNGTSEFIQVSTLGNDIRINELATLDGEFLPILQFRKIHGVGKYYQFIGLDPQEADLVTSLYSSISKFEDAWVRKHEGWQASAMPYRKTHIALHKKSSTDASFQSIEFSVPKVLSLHLEQKHKDWQRNDFILFAFISFLIRLSEDSYFCFGLSVNGLEGVEGLVSSYVPCTITIDDDKSVAENFSQAKEVLAISKMQLSYPLDLGSRYPTMLSSDNPGARYYSVVCVQDLTELDEFMVKKHGDIDFALVIDKSGRSGCCVFDENIIDSEDVSKLLEQFNVLMEGCASSLDQTVYELPILPEAEKTKLLTSWNNTKADYPRDSCFHELFSRQAKTRPDAIAVIYEDQTLTYSELDKKSKTLAKYFQVKGVEPNQLVAICMDRSLDMVVGLLAVQKSGGAYVPLDPAYPNDRLSYMLADSKARIVLTHQQAKTKALEITELVNNNPDKEGLLVVSIDEDWSDIEAEVRNKKLEKSVQPSDLVYVIYTSGSTGKPKGVMIPNSALVNFLFAIKNKLSVQANDSFLAVTTYCFDIAYLELYLPLLVGAECILTATQDQSDPDKLLTLISKHKPALMQATPATWKILFASGWTNQENVTQLCGGEPLPTALQQEFVKTGSESWNMYGPTETTIWSTCQSVCSETPIKIGKPIANTQVYIVDSHGQLVPVGVAGELWIAGDGIAKGYVNRPDLTAEKFIQNPFSENQYDRLFKTGDLARWQEDGSIECLGRIDQQIKLRGFRIELGEIESVLTSHHQVKQAVVVVQESETTRLMAFFTSVSTSHENELVTNDLREYLADKLPSYMIPAFFESVSKFPLTPNGKVDRKKLAKQKVSIVQHSSKTEQKLSSDDIENKVHNLWHLVLQVEGIGRDDGFFQVGGNSLLAVSLAKKIQVQFNCKFLSSALFKYSTIRSISEYIQSQGVHKNNLNHNEAELSKEMPIDFDVRTNAKSQRTDKSDDHPTYYDDSIAIIGISCHFPGASNHWTFWENLKEGKESVHFFSKDELKQRSLSSEILDHPNFVAVQSGIEGKELFDPEFFSISSANAEMMSPQLRQLLLHSWSAVEDAGYICEKIPRTSVFMTATNFTSGSSIRKKAGSDHAIKDANEYVAWLLNQEGTIPTMISYQLGFIGQSSFVHTNCSSSLTALNSAVQSLRSKEVDYSLVGAASLSSFLEMGYIYQPGLNFSSDGHLKTFDANADGMILGEGVGVVLLKRTVDAIEDQDHIYALLRDVGINNDGSNKAGFYAPSVEGQSQAIQKVLERTQINPESITYVEAHGTGTALGDPIEVMSLSETYKQYTQKKQYCVIGSVKPNIGHLDTVAGLAGFIKVAMSLYHGQIPPSINFSKPNSEIDFADTPFYVNQQLKTWEAGDSPRRAALSSFGIGGTNTHAVLEEINISTQSDFVTAEHQNDNLFVVPISAKNASNLIEYASSFINYLKLLPAVSIQQEQAHLGQLAYTMQTGRKSMAHRVIVLVRSAEDMIDVLQSFVDAGKSNNYWTGSQHSQNTKQSVLEDDDAKELAQKWASSKQYDKLAKLWANGFLVDWSLLYSNSKQPSRISLPTYPFSKERYWFESAVEQKRNIEKDQITRVIHPLLHNNTSSFSQQRFTSSFNGKEFFLADHIVGGEKTLPGVAYLEMVRAAVESSLDFDDVLTSNIIIRNVVWIKPIVVRADSNDEKEVHIDLFQGSDSNSDQHEIHYEVYTGLDSTNDVTVHSQGVVVFGELKGPVQSSIQDMHSRMTQGVLSADTCYLAYTLMGIDYGVGHQGVNEIYRGKGEILAKLNLPEAMLGTESSYVLHPCLMDSALQASVGLMLNSTILPDSHANLRELNSDYLKLNLPFALEALEIIKPCTSDMYTWIRYSDGSGAEDKVQKMDVELFDKQGNICVKIRGFTSRVLEGEIGVFNDNSGIGTFIASPEWLESPALSIYQRSPPQLAYTKHVIFTCELQSLGFKEVKNNALPDLIPGCLHIELTSDMQTLASRFTDYAVSCFNFVQKIMNERLSGNVLIQIVTPNTTEDAVHSGLSGLLKTAMIENPKIKGQMIQVDTEEPLSALAEKLLAEKLSFNQPDIKYQDEKRFVPSWSELVHDTEPFSVKFNDDGCYLITGGLGGLGLLFAADILRETENATVILTGRSALSAQKEVKLNSLKSLGGQTGKVKYFALDISDLDQMKSLTDSIQREYGVLNGILHCAGIIADNFIIKKTSTEFREVLSPKVIGTYNLDEMTKDMPLDFFVMFSSSVGSTGNVGQADYATANAFMNQYSAYRNELLKSKQRHGQAIAINWPLWKDGGMGVDESSEKMMRQTTGMVPMNTDVGIKAFHVSLQSQQSQTLVMEGDLDKLRSTFLADQVGQDELIEQVEIPLHSDTPEETVLAINNNGDLEEKTQKLLKKELSSVLKRPAHRIDAQAQLENYGMDSILAMTLTNELENTFGSLSKTLFFEFQTIAELASYFIESYQAKLTEIFKRDIQTVTPTVSDKLEPEVANDAPVMLSARQKRRKPTFLSGPAKTNSALNDAPEIAIIGMSGRYPKSNNINEYWENLRDGRDCITEVPQSRWDWKEFYSDDRNEPGHHYSKWGGFINGVDEFDPLFFNISPREAIELDPQERLFLEHAWMAIEDAGYTRGALQRPMGNNSTGDVGVYAGSMYGEYQLFGAEESLKGNRMGFSSCLSSIANRVSYVLDLHGPSMTVDTMCSASLSSIHLASQDLKLGRTDIGIAGGVNVTIHPNKYLMLSAGQFLSTKGHCESFGEGGGGYIPAEGVGVVLLKRLEDAERDGDQIYGVILASAVNHGGKTNGFNVPNLKAQRSLIERVISDSKVDPRWISYVEAHGTGTKLGDPIEIAALTQAFGKHTKDKAFCRIGSSKSNIGHCEGAAGIGGLAKVLLQFKHQKIVPSLHSSTLNPNINFDATPFIVNQELINWDRPVIEGKEIPRIASISSFGAGGSNGHLIIKEYPGLAQDMVEEFSSNQPAVMVPLSAKTPEQLLEMVSNLLTHIKRPTTGDTSSGTVVGLDLNALSYTLQVGRESMKVRLGFIVISLSELEQKLEEFLSGMKDIDECYQGQIKQNDDALAFIASDDEFNAMVDKWMLRKKYSKLLDLWSKGQEIDWQKLYGETKPRRISLPTYPFAKERYWVSETPSNVVDLLSDKPASVIHPLVHENTSDFSVQRFSSTFTGDEFFLNDHQVNGEKVLPGVGYLEMARAAIEKAMGGDGERATQQNILCLRRVVWSKALIVNKAATQVHIALASEYTGSEQAAAIHYEIYTESDNRHDAIIYSQGIASFKAAVKLPGLDIVGLQSQMNQGELSAAQCYPLFKAMGLNYGIGHQGISTLYRGENQLLAKLELPESVRSNESDYVLHPSLMDSALQASIGLVLDAATLERGSIPALSLPFALESIDIIRPCTIGMYAWVRHEKGNAETAKVQKLDIDLCDMQGNICVQMKGFTSRIMSAEQREIPQETSPETKVSCVQMQPIWQAKTVPENSIEEVFSEHLVMLCELPQHENERSKNELELLLKGSRCVALESNKVSFDKRYIEHAIRSFELIRVLLERKLKGKVLIQIVVPNSGQASLSTGLSGLLKTAMLESSRLKCQLIQVNPADSLQSIALKLKENKTVSDQSIIKYENENRFIASWEEINTDGQSSKVAFKDKGVYLITGGLGGLGLVFAKEILAQTKGTHIVLTGRSELSSDKQSVLDGLNTLGGHVAYLVVDVTDALQVNSLITQIQTKHGGLNGVIHSAGVIADNFILKKTTEEFRQVMAPKVAGTFNLDSATQTIALDFLVLFSSTSAVLGNIGQVDYAAANGFVDQFAYYRNQLTESGQRQGQTVSINWPLWKEGGMHVDAASEAMLTASTGMVAMQTVTGLNAFYQSLNSPFSQRLVMEGLASKLRHLLLPQPEQADVHTSSVIPAGHTVETKGAAKAEIDQGSLRAKIETMLFRMVSERLKIKVKDIDLDTELNDYGFDSVSLTGFSNQLNQQYKLDLAPTIFFEYSRLDNFASYLAQDYTKVFSEHLNVERQPDVPVMPHQTQAVSQATNAVTSSLSSVLEKRKTRFFMMDETVAKASDREDIAVIGMSGCFPGAENLEQFWENLESGANCITEIPSDRWDWTALYGDPQKEANKTNIKWGGFLKSVADFDPLFFGISPREAELMDPQQRLLMTYSYRAIEDAGYSASSLSGSNTGIFVGTTSSDYSSLILNAGVPIEGYSSTGKVPSVGPNRMSYFLNVHGPSEPIETACSSSLVAIHRAISAMNDGSCDAAIVGGVNTIVSPENHISFNKAGMLSEDGRCKTFSADANGYVRGEGVGMLFLKVVSKAESDGDHIYGLIKGSAENHGGRANSLTAPNPKAQAALINTAYTKAGLDPKTITYIEAHGTGTELGDPIEINGLKKAFKDLYQQAGYDKAASAHCGIGSVKTNIGHLELAAGVAGVIKVLLQFKHQKLVKTLHCQDINPFIDLKESPFYIVQEAQTWARLKGQDGQDIPRRAGISSFGFGGSNAHVILEEYGISEELNAGIEAEMEASGPVVIPLSARTQEQLKQQVSGLLSFIQNGNDIKTRPDTLPSVKQEHDEKSMLKSRLETKICDQLLVILELDKKDLDQSLTFSELGAELIQMTELYEVLCEELDLELGLNDFLAQNSIETLVQYCLETESIGGQNLTSSEARVSKPRAVKPTQNLNSIAYTLQIGRDAMEERLGFIVSSLEELEEKLTDFLSGNEAIEDCFQGQVKRNKEALSVFSTDDELQEALEKWMSKKKYSKLLDLWTKGLVLNWNKLYIDAKPARISLPTYPFAKDRYWFTHPEPQTIAIPLASRHSSNEIYNVNSLVESLIDEVKHLGVISSDTTTAENGS